MWVVLRVQKSCKTLLKSLPWHLLLLLELVTFLCFHVIIHIHKSCDLLCPHLNMCINMTFGDQNTMYIVTMYIAIINIFSTLLKYINNLFVNCKIYWQISMGTTLTFEGIKYFFKLIIWKWQPKMMPWKIDWKSVKELISLWNEFKHQPQGIKQIFSQRFIYF